MIVATALFRLGIFYSIHNLLNKKPNKNIIKKSSNSELYIGNRNGNNIYLTIIIKIISWGNPWC